MDPGSAADDVPPTAGPDSVERHTAHRDAAAADSNRVIAAITDSWDHPRTMVGVSTLLDWAAEHGLDRQALLDGSHIEPALLPDPVALVEARQELAVIRNLVLACDDRPGLGVDVGARYHLTAYGHFGYLLATCGSAREIAELGLHYALLTFAFSTMTAHLRDGDGYVLAFDADDVPSGVRRFAVERDAAATMQIQREVFPGADRVPLRAARFAFPLDRPGDAAAYRRHFGVPVSFDAPRTELVFDAAYLDQVPPMANRHTAKLMTAECERIRTERLHRTGVAARVRALLLDQTSLGLTLETVAERLHYAPRTLRRHLEGEGTTFRAILDEVRRVVAEKLLHDPSVPRYEIARRLGYQDWSSVARARRRWSSRSVTA
ncbi:MULTISPECIES: AraC family transcriptional regulator [Prauserella salsuginis group]|uniref:AraC family transcriptional regulator ligand-binding domain-containing protein n=1 Tax=Prauserella salsuginis TaxID=387889 RepID=A0ABW6G1M1_9PSEU|nr:MULTISPECIES: AraC family transcriptional regulator [Prauserella salsuginis group]MCR3722243.1 AraC-type DNA-binding protein [Prauserella flava]MCR3736241.1 AraC-type DNA-binding protein [Prauserella salsuginis]